MMLEFTAATGPTNYMSDWLVKGHVSRAYVIYAKEKKTESLSVMGMIPRMRFSYRIKGKRFVADW